MELALAVRGFLLGFAIAAPVGPIGVLVIRRTLAAGPRTGLVSGLGAATADAGYGLIAVMSLTALTRPLVAHADLFRLGGGVFLGAIGLRTLLAQPTGAVPSNAGVGRLWSAYLSTLALTVTNPMTILSFAAAFAGLGVAAEIGTAPVAGLVVVGGVFLGSGAWWAILSGSVGLLRANLGSGALRAVNWLSGSLLLGFGLLAVLRFRT
jgi:threonine/homoserine/homoserine lactone efflux protein